MKNIFLAIGLILFFSTQSVYAQTDEQSLSKYDCMGCHQFDFWIGDWKVEWINEDGSISVGENIVKSILNGRVIEETFEGSPEMDFRGKSLSVYNHNFKVWEQTWVDTEGFYMLFTGGVQNDQMILSRTVETTQGRLIQRMVFYNIQKDSFDWNWESSKDNGATWELKWKIIYTRSG